MKPIPLNLAPHAAGAYVLRPVAKAVEPFRGTFWLLTSGRWEKNVLITGKCGPYSYFPHEFPPQLQVPTAGSTPRGYRIPFWWETFNPTETLTYMLWDRETRTYTKKIGVIPIETISLAEVRVRVDHVPWTWTRECGDQAFKFDDGHWWFRHGRVPGGAPGIDYVSRYDGCRITSRHETSPT